MMTDVLHRPRILVADDQPDLLESLRLLLSTDGFEFVSVSGPDAMLEALKDSGSFDLLLMDLNYTRDTTSGREGLDLLPRIRSIDEHLPVVVMTGWSTVDIAVEAMRAYARDFVQKPWDNAHLLALLRREVEKGREARRLHRQQERELQDARQTQRGLMPLVMPALDGWEIATSWQAARDVAGDAFDAFPFASDRMGLCIADVVGKGVPAALLMSGLLATVKAFAADGVSPGAVCTHVNRVLAGTMPDGKFVSVFYCVIDAAAGTITYANAGHNAPIVVRADGAVERLSDGGTLIGLFAESRYDDTVAKIASGDRVVLFTDGIVEARDENGDEFGDDRLIEVLVSNRHLPAQALQDRVTMAVTAHCRGCFADDATLIVLAGR
jgi:sigma-B regulation protein RsbU (phosphoserine phosphatase)